MEERDVLTSGHVVKVNEAPQGFNLAQHTLQFSGPTVESPAPVIAPAPVISPVSFPAVMAGSTEGKKKRGRPRKCDSVGKFPLSPMPISSSIPLTGEFSGWKRDSGKPFESTKKSSKFYSFEGKPENATSAGSNLEIHVLTVNSGEDVTMKIMELAQKGFHGICILSANGTIKNVTLRQPTSSGGTSTYEGIFEILSLTGSFMPTENGFTKSRSGGLSVQLATTDGRVMGGGLSGLLIAATPVRVVVGSFLPPGHAPEPKVRKQKVEHKSTPNVNHVNSVSAEMKMDVNGIKPFVTSSGFQIQHIGFNNGHDSRNSSAAAETLEKESDLSHSDAGAAC